MTDLKRLEEKLPSLIVDKPTTTREGSADYQQKGRQLRKLRQRNPSRYLAILHKIRSAIEEMDREAIAEIDEFNRRCRSDKTRSRQKQSN